ncbi:hypothetical protein [Kingella sp. (in: b-proteobacteria)]|nr:hypothetical protein [Kingella sp. (in: b-proteobacteria)]
MPEHGLPASRRNASQHFRLPNIRARVQRTASVFRLSKAPKAA